MPGPAPKRPGTRARRNKASTAAKLGKKTPTRRKKAAVRPPAVRTPPLPSRACECGGPPPEPPKPKRGAKRRPGRPRKKREPCAVCADTGIRPWNPLVKRWWAHLWSSPMSDEYHESDIHRLYMAASLMEEFWETGGTNAKLHGEIRMALQPFGTTPLDRRRLDWELPGPEDGAGAEPDAPLPPSMPDPRLMPESPSGRPN